MARFAFRAGLKLALASTYLAPFQRALRTEWRMALSIVLLQRPLLRRPETWLGPLLYGEPARAHALHARIVSRGGC